MSDISPKERLSRAIEKKPIDRPPVICPGGMMNSATVDVMTKSGYAFPAAHSDSAVMENLARAVNENSGFENFGIPFCMTIEAEVLGSEINMGNLSCEPKIQKEVFPSVSAVEYRDTGKMMKEGRVQILLDAAYGLSRRFPDVPVIGSVTGPVSTAASIVDPMVYLKELRKDAANAHKLMEYVTGFLIGYARALVESGAHIISIADPTATGEILGPKMFNEYAVRYINKLVDAIHDMNTRVIVHICGKMDPVKHLIPEMKADVISTDAMVSLKALKAEYPGLVTMGNLSTFALQNMDAGGISAQTHRLVRDGINIIAPACGLSTTTPIENIVTMTGTVKEKS